MKTLLAYIATSIYTAKKDAAFNAWCLDAGIVCPHAEVRTTPDSVAGRGVFSTENLSRGDVVISIPYNLALTQDNAARYFPTLADKLQECRNGRESYLKRIWNRIRKKPAEKLTGEDFWQAELSAYALAALETDHPWSNWISQWQRDDPFQKLIDIGTWKFYSDPITKAVSEYGKMAPEIPCFKINAAVEIRLSEVNQYTERYRTKVPTSESLYATLISRAIGLSESVTACLPMHDMINHSSDPNLAFTFCDGNFELVALHDIPKDKELFLSYMDISNKKGEWDEDKATWLLVQWGIPSSPSKVTMLSSSKGKELSEKDEVLQSNHLSINSTI